MCGQSVRRICCASFPVWYYLAELLNVGNVLAQFYFTDYFLDGQFGRIASEGLALEENNSILPILAECRLQM